MVDYFKYFPDNYKWVCLSVTGLVLQCFFMGFIYINRLRSKTFTQEYMTTHFKDVQIAEIGKPPKKGGYPDIGCGKYADKLTIQEWMKFNSGFRGHMNFVENLPAMVYLTLLLGLFYPITAASFGLAHFVLRFLYIAGYLINPAFRLFSFAPSMALTATEIIMIIVGIIKQLF